MHFYLIIYLVACLFPSFFICLLTINSIDDKNIFLNVDSKFFQTHI